jgi:hypothetical protein
MLPSNVLFMVHLIVPNTSGFLPAIERLQSTVNKFAVAAGPPQQVQSIVIAPLPRTQSDQP